MAQQRNDEVEEKQKFKRKNKSLRDLHEFGTTKENAYFAELLF